MSDSHVQLLASIAPDNCAVQATLANEYMPAEHFYFYIPHQITFFAVYVMY